MPEKQYRQVRSSLFPVHYHQSDSARRSDPDSAGLTLAKLQNPVRESFDVINNDLKDVYKKLNNYDKSLAKVFPDSSRIKMFKC